MTLILTSVRRAEVLLTADGRSTVWRGGQVVRTIDDLQKIFPVPDHPLAVAHHGENVLDDKPVAHWIIWAVARINAGNLSLEAFADELRALFHAPVRRRLRALRNSRFGFGLVVAGFGAQAPAQPPAPGGTELWWQVADGVVKTEERAWGPITITPSGDGVRQIPAVEWKRIATPALDDARAYHAQLMAAALTAGARPNTVGGHVHELVITPEGCRWSTAPKPPAAQ